MAFWLSLPGAPPFELVPGKDVTIGRGRSCDVSVYSSLLSREHACIRWEGERPVLFDLESLNGIFIGPDRIHRHELNDGDVVRLGDLLFRFSVSEQPPKAESGSGFTPGEGYHHAQTPVEDEVGQETRFFSRTTAMQQQAFRYDELLWLLDRLEELPRLLAALRRGDLRAGTPLDAWTRDALAKPEDWWAALRLGVVAPRDHREDLPAEPCAMAERCALTKRGEKLISVLRGRKAHWNEMGALRYQVRQGRIFQPLRMVARAYRPGGGLAEVDVERLRYELIHIYAAEFDEAAIDSELRRLLCLGFLSPAEGSGAAAWYPSDWAQGPVLVARRGYAMLESFRLEDV
ncbi:MAG: FHA domain-containing protein [Planctomycetota bacterium]|nr:MAG: FHA domain-containing protein [Planctomycetota bacterium]